MPKIFWFGLLLLCTNPNFGQNVAINFKIQEESVVWQKAFSTSKEISAVFENVIQSGLLKDARIYQHTIYGDMRDFYFKPEGDNYKKLPLLQKSWLRLKYSAYLTLQYNGGTVIASIKKIGIYNQFESSPSESFSYIESLALKKDGSAFSDRFSANLRSFISDEFTRMLHPLF